MPYQRKSLLLEKLAALGETAPSHWNRAQIESRILELQKDEGPTVMTERKNQLAALQKANKNKSAMVDYMMNNLQMSLSGNETMKVLYARAYEHVMKASPSTSEDFMEFGKHSGETYGAVMDQDPQYAQWCITTMMENTIDNASDWRLIRFAKWAQEVQKGWHPSPAKTPKKSQKPQPQSDASGSDFSLVSKKMESPAPHAIPAIPSSEDEMLSDTECHIQELESQIRALQRRQKDKKHKTSPARAEPN